MNESLPAAHDLFPHIRIVMGMIVGLGVTRLLSGVVRIVQHPKLYPIYLVHLLWVASMLLMLVHFWWWEFGLYGIKHWTFERYLFILLYAVALFMLCAFLFPESMQGYLGYQDFFYAKRAWFFGLLAIIYILDFFDTLLKGKAHLTHLGIEYYIRTPLIIALSIVAMKTENRYFHILFVIFMILYQISWIARLFDTI